MIPITPYFKSIRPQNAAMTACAVALGYWLSGSSLPISALFLLIIASVLATGFGNVINDIVDCESDKINHPNRPLPQGEISIEMAMVFALVLLVFSLIYSFLVSVSHGIATGVPLILLFLYALFLKNTTLIGNTIVSLLVAYPLVYGGLGSDNMNHLYIPTLLAFLLNLMREIVKDLEDVKGDSRHGITTTAVLSEQIIKTVLLLLTVFYFALILIPYLAGYFKIYYLAVSIGILIPLHIYITTLIVKKEFTLHLSKLSQLIKWEMLGGLFALAVDRGIMTLLH